MLKQYMMRCVSLGLTAVAVLGSSPLQAGELVLSDTPLFLQPSVAPLNMLVVGRDHKLYYEAYNDASDLNGDGKLDVGYKGYLTGKEGIDYYGYFDSYKCYTYDGSKFAPARFTTDKKCGGSDEWSGDYLNYLTMSRIDALRKVLYGGKREIDSNTETTLIRSHIPMDAHSWGKEYSWDAPAAFNIRDFTPYERPAQPLRHLFANTTPNNEDVNWETNNRSPRLRVLKNRTYRIWEWVSKESPVAGTQVAPPTGNENVTFDNEYRVRVAVCVTGKIQPPDGGKTSETCKQYPKENYKPVGLLHEFGENNSMMFGLLTGSYTANKSGGVLRKNVGSITDEIDPDYGTLKAVDDGIIRTLDAFRVAGYTRYTDNGGTSYDCGLPAMAEGPMKDGKCRMWGNPVAEMMYETLRYFNGLGAMPAYNEKFGSDIEDKLGLKRATWSDPYAAKKYPTCAKPFQTVMADINNSYDSDQLPGSKFPLEVGSTGQSDDLGLDVGVLATKISSNEPAIKGSHFIGQSGLTVDSYDGAPTPKEVTDLGTIRGLAPEEPTKQGSYYAASVSYHGLTNKVNKLSTQTVQTFGVALASPLPKIEIPVGTGKVVTLVPFAKSVKYNSSIKRGKGEFQPTNQIVDFYVEDIAEDQRSGTFQVNFEDVEAGNDHDMDAIVRYKYQVTAGGEVQVDVSSDYQAGGIIHHIGYVISGTTQDGVYLVVQDCNKGTDGKYGCNSDDPDYFLDTPEGQLPGGTWEDKTILPGFSTRKFTPASTGSGATLLQPPLWYAAKWGGFKDGNKNQIPDVQDEWDADKDGNPDNYFLVTNALTLSQQLRKTFTEIIDRSSSASAASVNSGAISTDTRIYQAQFNTEGWTGQLYAYGVDAKGVLTKPEVWEASKVIPDFGARNIFTVNSDGKKVPFLWDDLDATRRTQLSATEATSKDYVDYLRGKAIEGLRERTSRLGDIVSSAPIYVGPPRARYSDNLEAKPYSTFASDNRERDGVVYVGANDGMLHAFKADHVVDPDGSAGPKPPVREDDKGEELYAFIPQTVFGNLPDLTKPSYSHSFFVDGSPNSNDVFTNDNWRTVLVGGLNAGGQGIYAIDITKPSSLNKDSFLWEITDKTSTDFRDLGYTFSQPAIVRLQDGTWAAVFGNGYNNTTADGAVSTTGNAVLYVVDIETGKLLRKFDTGVGMSADPLKLGRPNGMATPTMVDVDGDRVVDHAYVGDLFGNLWKIDLRSKTPTEWGFAFGTTAKPEAFFVAAIAAAGAQPGDPLQRQPITTRVEVARGPFGAGVMVLFGTGKFLEATDKQILPRADQTFYGLVDQNTYTATDRIADRSVLQKQTIEQEIDLPNKLKGRQTSNTGSTGGRGWYLDLISPVKGYQGERVIADPIVRDDRVIFSTLLPNNDICGAGGSSWLMVLDLLSGSRLPEAQLDTNGDGKIDEKDNPNISGTSAGEDGGILSRPAGLRCLSSDCLADRLISSSTNGGAANQLLRSLVGARGRQSWRQIR
jgi:type IV pilus assembly protein PilY1